jgi:flagellar biosynthetic protein FliQ
MNAQSVLTFGREALTLLLMISLPVLLTVMAVGLVVSIFQAVTQINEATCPSCPSWWRRCWCSWLPGRGC